MTESDAATRADGDGRVDAEAVADYLRRHPDFFETRADLLTTLRVNHADGPGTISLIERQVAVLREKQTSHRERLETLLHFAEANHAIYLRTQRLVLGVLEAENVGELFHNLERTFADDFGCAAYGLIVFDQTPRQINHYTSCVTLTTAQGYVGDLISKRTATLGLLDGDKQDFLLRHASGEVGSAAVLPIYAGNSPIAVLALGARESGYFDPGSGTVFIDFVGDVLARTLPRYLYLGDPG